MFETFIAMVVVVFPMIFTNNLVVAFVKYLADYSATSSFLRGALIVSSIVGIIAGSAISGNPVDFNQVSDLARLLLEVIVAAVGSHFTYKAIKKSY